MFTAGTQARTLKRVCHTNPSSGQSACYRGGSAPQADCQRKRKSGMFTNPGRRRAGCIRKELPSALDVPDRRSKQGVQRNDDGGLFGTLTGVPTHLTNLLALENMRSAAPSLVQSLGSRPSTRTDLPYRHCFGHFRVSALFPTSAHKAVVPRIICPLSRG